MEEKVKSEVVGNGRTVAVTGASGYIGSAIVKLLLEKGYAVHGTVRDPTKASKVDHLWRLSRARDALTLFKADLLDEGSFDKVFKGCHCVFHTASPIPWEVKDPENDVIKPAVNGTLNVLESCKKAGVQAMVLTSSMAAADPRPSPPIKNETHWSDPEEQMKRGSHYGASKTLAERAAIEFVAKMPQDSAIRLARILPTFVVGPMLQPTVNTSMKYFVQYVRGTRHKVVKNDLVSLIDVRDCAAHHVAAYEGGHEGRFFSLVEKWHWSIIYAALKHFNPLMKCPQPMPKGTKPVQGPQIDSTRMKTLGVDERSMYCIIGDVVKVFRDRGMLDDK